MSYTSAEVYAALHGTVGTLRRACSAMEEWLITSDLPEEAREDLQITCEDLHFVLYGPGPDENPEDYEDPDSLWDRPEDDVGTVMLEVECWYLIMDVLEGMVNACPEVEAAVVIELAYSVAGASLHSFYSPAGSPTFLKPGQKDWFGEEWAVAFYNDPGEPPEDVENLDLGFPPEAHWVPFTKETIFGMEEDLDEE